jgi:hypothetical protein
LLLALCAIAVAALVPACAPGLFGRPSFATVEPAAPWSPSPPAATGGPALAAGKHLSNSPAQPGTILFGGDEGALLDYAHPGALVISGRENYASDTFKKVAAAGATELLYIDPMIDNAHGRYHDMLINASPCGPATALWPGQPRANEYGKLTDFRVGSTVQAKLGCVLEAMVRENPQMGGFFADDVGSRSYFPGFRWDSWSTADKQAYRDGAIAIMQTMRTVADRHRIIVLVNGSWNGGDPLKLGGGYPDAATDGISLAEGGVLQNHDNSDIAYLARYSCSAQWAAESKVTNGQPFNYATTNTVEGRDSFARNTCVAWANVQPNYWVVGPLWADFHPTGLPHKTGG